jgi:glycerol-3-phosphate cytidylyltransferase
MRIGLTAGSFDLIHPGYVRMFKEAREICHYLIVALQDDPTIDRANKLKPVQTWEERKEILESLKYVDEVIRYSTESELVELLKTTKFDVRILGSDYINKKYTGDFLNKEVYFCRREHDYSLTSLKKKIYESVKDIFEI